METISNIKMTMIQETYHQKFIALPHTIHISHIKRYFHIVVERKLFLAYNICLYKYSEHELALRAFDILLVLFLLLDLIAVDSFWC